MKERFRLSQTTSSSVAARYRAPEPEQDAGPVFIVEHHGDEDEEDEAESRAVAGPTLPPLYSSVTGAHDGTTRQQAQAAAGDQKRES